MGTRKLAVIAIGLTLALISAAVPSNSEYEQPPVTISESEIFQQAKQEAEVGWERMSADHCNNIATGNVHELPPPTPEELAAHQAIIAANDQRIILDAAEAKRKFDVLKAKVLDSGQVGPENFDQFPLNHVASPDQ